MLKKQPILLGAILLAAIGGIWLILNKAPQREQAPKDETSASPVTQSLPPTLPPSEFTSPPSALRQDPRTVFIEQVVAHPGYILPAKDAPQAHFLRFWFYSDQEFYSEYAIGEYLQANRMAFVSLEGETFTRAALYEAGPNGWELVEGTDVLLTKPQKDLYTYNAEAKTWVKSN